MNLQLLETFVKVAELKNFTRAAEQLKYAQPTVTLHIQKLEQELDVCLIEREIKGIRLTAEGEKFLPLAQNVLKEWENAMVGMKQKEDLPPKLVLGCPEILAISVLIPVVEKMYRQFPGMSMDIVRCIYPENVEMLARREVDFIYVINRRMNMDGLSKLFEIKSQIVFACSARHPILAQDYTLKDLEKYPFIVPLNNSMTSYVHDVMECFLDYDVHIRSMMRCGSVTMMREMLLKNVGISCLPYFFVQKDVERGEICVLNFEGIDIYMYQQLFCMSDRTLSYADSKMIEYIREEIS